MLSFQMPKIYFRIKKSNSQAMSSFQIPELFRFKKTKTNSLALSPFQIPESFFKLVKKTNSPYNVAMLLPRSRKFIQEGRKRIHWQCHLYPRSLFGIKKIKALSILSFQIPKVYYIQKSRNRIQRQYRVSRSLNFLESRKQFAGNVVFPDHGNLLWN